MFWLAAELINYLVFLPVLLSATAISTRRPARFGGAWLVCWRDLLPLAALIGSCAAALVVGGPGALAFTVPALLWCGLSYPVFPTAVVTLLFGLWAMVAIAAGHVPILADQTDEMGLISIRLGASLIALAPILLASITQNRNESLRRLHELATRDALTGTDSRGAFLERAQALLAGGAVPSAALMIDIDHFKRVNDQCGHAGGDDVLVASAARAAAACAPALCWDVRAARSSRFSSRTARLPLPAKSPTLQLRLRDGCSVSVRLSVGMVTIETATGAKQGLEHRLGAADAALYRAKNGGRNRLEAVVWGECG